jgi:hypothetical protein
MLHLVQPGQEAHVVEDVPARHLLRVLLQLEVLCGECCVVEVVNDDSREQTATLNLSEEEEAGEEVPVQMAHWVTPLSRRRWSISTSSSSLMASCDAGGLSVLGLLLYLKYKDKSK